MWLVLSIGTAVFLALRDFSIKRHSVSMEPLTLIWSLYLFSIPIMLVIILILGIPPFNGWTVIELLVGGGCDALASVLYVLALSRGDLSKSIPMLSFIPVFQLLSAPLVLNETPSLIGGSGIILVVIGTYVIHISKDIKGIFAPIRSLIQDRSCQMMLGVAVLWSISAMYHKKGVLHYPAYFWVFMVIVFIGLVTYPFLRIVEGPPWKKVFKHPLKLMIPSVFHIGTLITLYAAVALTHVAYVSSIRRLSILIGIVLGIVFLKEQDLKSKLIGGMLMVCGAVVITLAKII